MENQIKCMGDAHLLNALQKKSEAAAARKDVLVNMVVTAGMQKHGNILPESPGQRCFSFFVKSLVLSTMRHWSFLFALGNDEFFAPCSLVCWLAVGRLSYRCSVKWLESASVSLIWQTFCSGA